MWFPLVVALWHQVERKPRNLHRMLLPPAAAADVSERAGMLALENPSVDPRWSGGSAGDLAALQRGHGSTASLASRGPAGTSIATTLYPTAALFVTCYTEPVDVIQPTVLAALMQEYPPDRVQVVVCCDDPRRSDVPDMVASLQRMRASTARALPSLTCIVRPKVAGVGHHAKAGNINSAMFASGVNADFVVVLDSDMVTDARFLSRTIGHFLERNDGAAGGSGGSLMRAASPEPGGGPALSTASADWTVASALRWRRKQRAGFLQTPQVRVLGRLVCFVVFVWRDPAPGAPRPQARWEPTSP